jgi:hypothetical protein
MGGTGFQKFVFDKNHSLLGTKIIHSKYILPGHLKRRRGIFFPVCSIDNGSENTVLLLNLKSYHFLISGKGFSAVCLI